MGARCLRSASDTSRRSWPSWLSDYAVQVMIIPFRRILSRALGALAIKIAGPQQEYVYAEALEAPPGVQVIAILHIPTEEEARDYILHFHPDAMFEDEDE